MMRYDAEMPTWKADLSRPGRLTAALNYYRANLALILPKRWPKATVPVMGIWGEGDVATAERQMVESSQHVAAPWRYERVPGGTHCPSSKLPTVSARCCSTSSPTPRSNRGPEGTRCEECDMKLDKVQTALGAALIGTFAAFWRWHSPFAKPLTSEEIDHYLAVLAQLPLPGDEAERLVAKLRPWAESDDGRQFYMLNMIRFYDELHPYPGAPDFDGTPEESNAFYEKSFTVTDPDAPRRRALEPGEVRALSIPAQVPAAALGALLPEARALQTAERLRLAQPADRYFPADRSRCLTDVRCRGRWHPVSTMASVQTSSLTELANAILSSASKRGGTHG